MVHFEIDFINLLLLVGSFRLISPALQELPVCSANQISLAREDPAIL